MLSGKEEQMLPGNRGVKGSVFGWWLFAGLAAALGLVAATGWAEDEAFSPFNGRNTYKSYCMNCHGEQGKGDGYVSSTLKVPPPDLTQLAKQNGGVYPAERVTQSIDGSRAIRSHGTREMPIWGDVFIWPEEDSPERREQVRRKIGELVEYLKTLQEP